MIKDKKGLYFIIDESIERDLNNEEEKHQRIKFYLKRDHLGGYVLVDTESGNNNCSIKCIFSQEGLKEYLAGVPSYIDYDSFENCQILLKNYRFDYLIFENDQNSLIYKLVCYIENFEVDATYKLQDDNIPKNINLDSVIKNKIESVVNNFLKKSHKDLEVDSGKNIFIFNAKNFINRSFYEAESEQKYTTHIKAFDIIKQSKNIDADNVLLKTGICLSDPFSYLQDFEAEIKILNSIKNFDFTPAYSLCPTQLDKVKGEEFKASDVDISQARQEIIVRPSDLNFEVDLSQEKIKDFLLKKVKRQRPVHGFDKLPENIKNLIISYGDVSSNITDKTFESYLFYRKFIEFEKRSDRMDLV